MTTLDQGETTENPGETGVRRRDFINISAVSFAGVGALAVIPPLVNQMNPSADVLALASPAVELSALQHGQSITTVFSTQSSAERRVGQACVSNITSQLLTSQ